MSHISKIKTQFSNEEYLLEALKALGLEPERGTGTIQSLGGYQAAVEFRVRCTSPHCEVGFRREAGRFVCIADAYTLPRVKQTLLQSLTQQYARIAVEHEMAAQGFTLAEENLVNGSVHLVLRRMG